MPNETCESLVREICVHGSELVTLVESHAQEANQLSFCIKIAPRTMRDVMSQDDLVGLPVELRKGGEGFDLLAGQLATTGVEPEEHGLPAVTVPGGIHTMAGCLSHKNHI